ncbi:MAG: hypothetical protein ACHQ4H_00830 [Ktedonobacterales bacterium]
MIWLTWRQHRIEAAIVLGVLALIAAITVIVGIDMRNSYTQLGIGNCLGAGLTSSTCGDALDAFRQQFGVWESAVDWLNLVPALLGILIGAPLVARELEHGTQRLVWTQSVTRWRWLAIKLLLVLVGCLVAAEVLSLLITWWRQPLDTLGGRFGSQGFDFEGIALLGYVLFALALAIAAGALLRRAIPAMVITLAGFLAVRLPIESHLRPYFQHPLSASFDITASPGAGASISRADWQFDSYFVNQAGQRLNDRQVYDACLNNTGNGIGATKLDFLQCVHSHGWLLNQIYQPADRFWTFQAIETSIFVALAIALLGLTVWWVRRRLS